MGGCLVLAISIPHDDMRQNARGIGGWIIRAWAVVPLYLILCIAPGLGMG